MSGYSAKLPLTYDVVDGLYSLNKTKSESIKQDFKMLLLTNPGERMMIPDYGVGLRRFLFDQNSTELINEITKKINEQVSKYMNFIKIDLVDINTNDEANSMNLYIKYIIPSSNKTDELILGLDSI